MRTEHAYCEERREARTWSRTANCTRGEPRSYGTSMNFSFCLCIYLSRANSLISTFHTRQTDKEKENYEVSSQWLAEAHIPFASCSFKATELESGSKFREEVTPLDNS